MTYDLGTQNGLSETRTRVNPKYFRLSNYVGENPFLVLRPGEDPSAGLLVTNHLSLLKRFRCRNSFQPPMNQTTPLIFRDL